MEVKRAIRTVGPAATSREGALPELSRREREVMTVVAFGWTNQEVATELHISVHAVKFHLASIYRKLGVTNRTEAVVRLLRGDTP